MREASAREVGRAIVTFTLAAEEAKRLGGEVGFNDAPGGGTIFHVELPAFENVTPVMP